MSIAGSFKDQAAEFANHVAAVRLDALPNTVAHEARRSFLNFIGCAIGGLSHEAVGMAASALLPFAGPPAATLIGQSVRSDPLTAALVNGTSANAHSFDDCHAEAVVHPASAIGGAALAVAEANQASGAELLLAFALGVEATCRLSKAISVAPAVADIAWYQTGICSGVGAAIAASKILRLTPEQIRAAIGIAVSQASGSRIIQGSMCMLLLSGHAAQVGVRAALLAAKGFESLDKSIEGKYGFCEVFSTTPNAGSFSSDLSSRFEILANTYKAYPCGIVLRPIIDACLALTKTYQFESSQIARIEVDVHPLVMTLTDRRHPANRSEGQVSVHHWAVAALVFGKAGITEGSLAVLQDPAIVSLCDKVHPQAKANIGRNDAVVTVQLTNGTRLTEAVRSPDDRPPPMSDRDLESKVHSQGEGLFSPEKLNALIHACWRIDALPNIAELTRQL